MNDPLYNHSVFGPEKGRYGNIGKSDEQLIQDLIAIHNAENWLGMDIDADGGGTGGSAATLQDRLTNFSPQYSPLCDETRQHEEATSTTKNLNSPRNPTTGTITKQDPIQKSISKISSDDFLNFENATSSKPSHENSTNKKVLTMRAETPDSAVDVNSLPASADSPSSSSSSNSPNTNFQHNLQHAATNVSQSATPISTQTESLNSTLPAPSNKVPHISTSSSPPSSTAAVAKVKHEQPISQRCDERRHNVVSGNINITQTIATQTGIEEADERFNTAKLSIDSHCYECKVKYRDPSPKDLVMFLHAYTYTVSSMFRN